MDKVIVKNLKIKTCHGVNDFEKREPQPFLFSAEVDCDFYPAAAEDDLGGTVNYSSVCKELAAVASCGPYNLIETLAYRCAQAVLEKFPQATGVTVRVDKPRAPVKAKFKTVAAVCTLKKTTAYLSLGSSMGDKKAYLDFAVRELGATRGIELKKVSAYVQSAPYGGVAKNTFLNACAEIQTYLPPRALLKELQRVETEGERTRELKWGDRTLDIDIIFYGDSVISEEGLIVPHPDYRNREFVLAPLAEIAPFFVCPLSHMRIKDIPLPKARQS